MGALGIMMLRRGTMANPIAGSDYILSEERGDPEVFRILMENGVSSDGVGITKEDAMRVTDISSWFNKNDKIEHFDEFQYFVNVTNLNPENQWDSGAFYKSSIKRITLHENMKVIHQGSFRSSSALEHINLEYVNEIQTAAFYNALNGAIINCESLLNLSNDSTFYGSKLSGIQSLGRVTSIKSRTDSTGAFMGSSAKFINLPETLEEIGAHSLRNMRYLNTPLYIPASVKSIGLAAFAYDTMTAVIALGDTPPTLGSDVFIGTSCPIYVPDSAVEAYKAAWTQYSARIYPMSQFQE